MNDQHFLEPKYPNYQTNYYDSNTFLVAVMECIKNCCKTFTKKKEPETQGNLYVLETSQTVVFFSLRYDLPGRTSAVERRGTPEDYLLSKMPPDGREVPFVLPTFKASYIQPKGQLFQTYSPAHKVRYAEVHTAVMVNSTQKSPHTRFDSASSVFSSASSMKDSIESSLDSIALSGDERDLGKVCVRVSYQEPLEQVWITLVQCSDLDLLLDGGETQKIGFKGVITVSKPIQFKSSAKTYQQDVTFMETFVFPLRLQQLRCSALVLRLQSLSSRRRTVAECVLSLRTLGSQETEHWLELNSPSKSSVYHSELHLATCFQPVNSRIQLQILSAQNLPPSSSPLTQAFFVRAELHQNGHMVMTRKTKALKTSGGMCEWKETCHFLLESLDQASSLTVRLYSRNSVRRKQCLGQILLGFDSPITEAVDQWKDTMAHPEKVVTAWHHLSPP
uniref:Tandem C2 domains, nuclear n=1 Tax=Neogobius melanostomus TaxID=47308 RepID=A0A8C6THZ7_9GOBI